MLKIAIPNKGSLSEAAVEILKEAGYAGRGSQKLSMFMTKIITLNSFSSTKRYCNLRSRWATRFRYYWA